MPYNVLHTKTIVFLVFHHLLNLIYLILLKYSLSFLLVWYIFQEEREVLEFKAILIKVGTESILSINLKYFTYYLSPILCTNWWLYGSNFSHLHAAFGKNGQLIGSLCGWRSTLGNPGSTTDWVWLVVWTRCIKKCHNITHRQIIIANFSMIDYDTDGFVGCTKIRNKWIKKLTKSIEMPRNLNTCVDNEII